MNQILFNQKSKNKKNIYQVQFVLSIGFAVVMLVVILINYQEDENLENISKSLDEKIKLSSIYNTTETNSTSELYFGKIIIDKINLEYTVFNQYSEELLKIAPCKFYGTRLGEKGNICIAAHNYNDDRFFGKIKELKIIKLIDLKNNEYNFIVYDIFEIDENDFSILKGNKNYELTLLTCNNSNNKRIIVKSYIKEY